MHDVYRACCLLLLVLFVPNRQLHSVQLDDSTTPTSQAAFVDDTWSTQQQDAEPAFSAALSIGMYRPRLSSDPAAQRLFATIFTQKQSGYFAGRGPLLTLEGAWYPFSSITKIGLLVQLQYWTLAGKAVVCKDEADRYTSCNKDDLSNIQLGEDTTSINLLPIAVGLIYRADMLTRAGIFPLFGLAKATVNNGFWWSTVGPYQGIRSARKILGHTLYYVFSLGLGYQLPAPKVSSSKSLQSALTLEAVYALGNAPHQTNNLDWTDTAQVYGVLGLLFDF